MDMPVIDAMCAKASTEGYAERGSNLYSRSIFGDGAVVASKESVTRVWAASKMSMAASNETRVSALTKTTSNAYDSNPR